MQRIKLIVIVALILVGVVIVLQNTEQVETRILFVTITMPRAVLLFGTTLIGFALGVLVSFTMTRQGEKHREADEQERLK